MIQSTCITEASLPSNNGGEHEHITSQMQEHTFSSTLRPHAASTHCVHILSTLCPYVPHIASIKTNCLHNAHVVSTCCIPTLCPHCVHISLSLYPHCVHISRSLCPHCVHISHPLCPHCAHISPSLCPHLARIMSTFPLHCA